MLGLVAQAVKAAPQLRVSGKKSICLSSPFGAIDN